MAKVTIVTIQHNHKTIEAGTITPRQHDSLFDVESGEPITMYDAVSAFEGSHSFYAHKSAEFWLETRAYVRA